MVRIAVPTLSVERFNILCGLALIAFGAIRLVGFYSRDLFRLAFQYDFEFGILIIVLGALIFIKPENLTGMTCVLLGVLTLADALFKIRITLEAKKFGIEQWGLLLGIALATSVLGGTLAFYLGKQLEVLLGITLIAEGLLSLFTGLTLVKIIRHQVRE